MLRITQIKIPAEEKQDTLPERICSLLRIRREELLSWKIVRRSIEARRQERLSYVYAVDAALRREDAVLKRMRLRTVSSVQPVSYQIPDNGEREYDLPPVIVGSGPAGLFCAYLLAQRGYCPVVLERGDQMEERKKRVEAFWNGNAPLDPESNVQFGEGGAGTFSDGKLNTGIRDRAGRIPYVLETFVRYGAPEEILYDAKPHMGTDVLYEVVRNLRNAVNALGGSFRFRTRLTDLILRNNAVASLVLDDGSQLDAEQCVLAIGHSARDTLKMLYAHNVRMQAKPFAVGVRIQHPQELINRAQWGENHPACLGAAPYSLSEQLPDGRGVYSFCMCPGGYVVNASSLDGQLAVNGMSYSGRGSGFANSALIVGVTPEDYLPFKEPQTPEALSAIDFQTGLEKAAFAAAQGRIPAQRFEDFAARRMSASNSFAPCTKGEWAYADVRSALPEFIAKDLTAGICEMGKKLKGFDLPDALLMGVESRTSSPVRILRDENLQSSIDGLIPCGEGAGYAGGIVSAAVDGMKAAEMIIRTGRPPKMNGD